MSSEKEILEYPAASGNPPTTVREPGDRERLERALAALRGLYDYANPIAAGFGVRDRLAGAGAHPLNVAEALLAELERPGD